MKHSLAKYLANDHGRLSGMLNEYREMDNDDVRERLAQLERFHEALNRHGKWVGEILLPEIKQRTDEDQKESLKNFLEKEQHHFDDDIRAIKEELESGNPDTDERETRLISSLKAHFVKEEKILYPIFDDVLDKEERESFIEQFERDREES